MMTRPVVSYTLGWTGSSREALDLERNGAKREEQESVT